MPTRSNRQGAKPRKTAKPLSRLATIRCNKSMVRRSPVESGKRALQNLCSFDIDAAAAWESDADVLFVRAFAQPWLRQLAFDPKRGQGYPRQAAAFVHQVARLPARKELGVEAIETLDLKEDTGSWCRPWSTSSANRR
jgi:hypothetical protein